jgi:predicted lipoprotein with Yx(FWY)xxD motif
MHMARTFLFVCAALLGPALLVPRPTAAAWPTDPFVNVPVCTAYNMQDSPTSVSDGAGGAIITWSDHRNLGWDIYAQRISADGTAQWTADGVALCTATSEQLHPTSVSDGAGGAIVTWYDLRNGNWDIYARRISADGTVQWAADGVALCTATRDQYNPVIVSDGAGGANIAWVDYRSGNNYDIYAQQISATGTVQWTANGVALCSATGDQAGSTIVSDDAGGAIVAWADNRSGTNYDIYAQRISAAGTPQWMANGVALCIATVRVTTADPMITSDGAGGAIVTWQDSRGGNHDIYAQRISAAGTVQWTANGAVLCSATNYQYSPTIVTDGAGGAIVTWHDQRSGISPTYYTDIYAQRISAAGTVQWTADGVALCTAIGGQYCPTIVSDGAGGAIVAWHDQRSGDSEAYADIYSQRISAGGAAQWSVDGVALCTDPSRQCFPIIVSNGTGGAIVTWEDNRSYYDIYAQNVNADGALGDVPTPVLLSLVNTDVGADFVTLTWLATGSGGDVATVYRSPAGGQWTRIGQITADGTGHLRYADPIDATATRVGYRLGIVDAGIEGFHGETWVDLPVRDAALAFALDPVRPNPTQGGALTVRFTLPNAAPARIELVDVSGRRVVEREVGSLGAGQHTLDLGEGQRLAPGLYLVRLSQGGNTRVTRVAVL